MARLKTVTFSASIENEAAIRRWMEEVQRMADAARTALDDLSMALTDRPHIAISLTAGENEEVGQ